MSRRGTSLVEVLVASVLLGVGVSGCLSTLAVAARFHERARAREEIAAEAHDRLGWFVSQGCVVVDTLSDASSRGLVQGEWTVLRDSLATHLSLRLARSAPLVDERFALEATQPC